MVRRRRQGFTLVEILVVIGIILLLIAIGVIGFQHIERVASERATKTNMDSLTAILNAYETSTGSMNLIEGSGSVASYSFPNGVSAPTGPMYTPWDVNYGMPDQYSQQNGQPPPEGPYNPAVFKTGLILQTMSRVPEVKNMIGALPPASMLPGISGTWPDNTKNAYPIVVDAWRNPIIYVPSGGLTGVNVTRGTGTSAVTVTAHDGRPFWASAGQDGNFSTGDDNIYSTPVIMK